MLRNDSASTSALVLDAVGHDVLTVPGGAWLLKAEFSVDGNDLLLTGADGAQVLIRDFFSLDPPPDLVTSGGALVSAELAVRLAGPQAPGQVAQLQDGSFQVAQAVQATQTDQGAEQPVGKVEATDGLVEAIHVDGTTVTLVKGSPIYQGDTIVTGKGAAIGITFIDDTNFSLGEEGRMVLDEMVYDPGGQDSSFSANLVQGVFSFVSGQIAKTAPDGMTVSTPVATIGIRGTKVAGRAAQEGEQNSISLLPETDAQGNTVVGELVVTNQVGTVTLNQIGATVQMSSAFQQPPSPVIISLQQIQQQYGAALNTLPAPAPANPDQGDNQNQGDGQNQGDNQNQGGNQEANAGDGKGGDGQGGNTPPDGGAIDQAARDAIAAGATEGEVLKAAADAAAAAGASPEDIAAAEQAYRQAIAGGASPEQALQAAGAAAGALAGDGPPGSQGGPGQGISGQGGPGVPGQGGPDQGGSPFFGGNNPFGSDGNPFGDGGDPFGGDSLFGGGGENPFGGPPGSGGGPLGNGLGPFGNGPDRGFNFNFPNNPSGNPPPDDSGSNIPDDPTTDEFQEVLNATTGNDSLVGGAGNTQFVMVQGVSLGGVDTIDGGGGTDEIAVQNLQDAALIYNGGANPPVLDFSDADGALTATVSLTSVEQLYANDGVETFNETSGTSVTVGDNGVRLPFSSGDSGFGYILAGTAGSDVISLANGVNLAGSYSGLSGVSGATVSTGNVLGSIIFGKGGDDTITGSEAGDIIFGGLGDDTIDGGGTTGVGSGEKIFAGGGADTINVTTASGGSVFVGGGGSDSLSYAGLNSGNITFAVSSFSIASSRIFNDDSVNDAISGIENLTGTSGAGNANTFNFNGNSSYQGLSSVNGGDQNDSFVYQSGATVTATLDGGAGTDSVQFLVGGNYTANLANIETVTGSAGAELVTFGLALTAATAIDLGASNDVIYLQSDTNTLNVSNVETIIGSDAADTLTLNTLTSGVSIDLGAGADVLRLADGSNSVALSNVETVVGGTGDDVITAYSTSSVTVNGGGGADVLNFAGSGSHTAEYSSASDGGDTVRSFEVGASGDVFQFMTGFGGAQTINLALESAGAGTAGANVIVSDSTLLASGTAAADAHTLLNSINFTSSANKFLVGIIDNDASGTLNSGDTYAVFYDTDASNGSATLIATTDIDASSTAASTWDASNFSALT